MAQHRRSWFDRLLLLALAGLALVTGPGGSVRTASGDPNPPATDDGLPVGMVAYFAGGKCPSGWVVKSDLQGRLAVGVTDGTTIGVTVGNPLGTQEDRWHKHTWTSTFTLPSKAVAGADGGNVQGAAAKAYTIVGETGIAPTGLPFVQVKPCAKQ